MSTAPKIGAARVIPAHLSFLAIYNPKFGTTDETEREQIVFYWSERERKKVVRDNKIKDDVFLKDEVELDENEVDEQLRQVGLARGMVDFVKNFSSGDPVDSIETEKSRIVLHELEDGWWILASVTLTQLPRAGKDVEYSSREVAPPALLLAQLKRAQAVFLLHHSASLADLYTRIGRAGFVSLLGRYWEAWCSRWDLMLHGNPAVEICDGVKVAIGGELGVGVGEEEWGSGEREVLEDFVGRTEGLVDLVVGRFGDGPEPVFIKDESGKEGKSEEPEPWLGAGVDVRPTDGVIFSGVGALSRRSLTTISQWIETIFKQGEDAYGVGENPSSRQRRGKARKVSRKPAKEEAKEVHPRVKALHLRAPDLRRKAMEKNATPSGIPPPLVASVERSLDEAIAKVKAKSPAIEKTESEAMDQSPAFDADRMMKYITLGYGSSWTLSPKGLPPDKADSGAAKSTAKEDELKPPDAKIAQESSTGDGSSPAPRPEIPLLQEVDPSPEVSDDEDPVFVQRLEQSIGKFIIGLSGDLENTEFDEDDIAEKYQPSLKPRQAQRIFLRTLTVEMAKPQATLDPKSNIIHPLSRNERESVSSIKAGPPPTSAASTVDGSHPIVHHRKLQIAVYMHQPFIFVFLFELQTASLTIPSFYRGLHHQLGPLQKPLLRSTDPARVAERLGQVVGERGKGDEVPQTIYDIIFDPIKLTVRTSIPNIPIPGSLAAEGLAKSVTVSGSWYTLGIPISSSTGAGSTTTGLVKSDWTRVEALNVHSQILNMWAAVRESGEVERTVKTGRGWWIVWMRVRDRQGGFKEAVLVRKAGDHMVGVGRGEEGSASGKWLLRERAREVSGSSTRSGGAGPTSAAGVSEGVGVDARKWVEDLLHFV